MSRTPLLLAAAMLAGCSRGDDGSFTLVADIAFYRTPVSGTFTVSDGWDALGCSRGTFVGKPVSRKPPVTILWVFSCTKGERTGSFTIRFFPLLGQPNDGTDPPKPVEAPWRFESGTRDFTGLDGKGDLSMELDGNNFSGVGTLTGNVAF